MADRTGHRPSKATKDRLSRLVEQDIIECGKVAKHLCQRSGSREVRVALFRESVPFSLVLERFADAAKVS